MGESGRSWEREKNIIKIHYTKNNRDFSKNGFVNILNPTNKRADAK